MSIVPILSLKNIHKFFPGVHALDDVSIDFQSGDVHVLLGENGAGKSTLVKIISGVFQADTGEIYYNGEPVSFHGVRDAQAKGISIIHQEFNLLPHKTIADNIFIGRELIKNRFFCLVDKKKMIQKSKELLDSLGIDIDPTMMVKELGVAQQQMVEVAKALAFKSKVLILDEPTATLTNKEIDNLFAIIRRLKNEGVCIIYISHRLEEIKQIGDTVTVLRDGQKIDTVPVKSADINDLITMIIGREIKQMYNRNYQNPVKEAIRIEDLSSIKFKNISLHAKYGEIVGITGLVGSGRTEVVKAVFGYDHYQSGKVYINGDIYTRPTTKSSFKRGLSLIPEDRKEEGLILEMDVKENIVASSLDKLFKNGLLNKKIQRKVAEQFKNDLRIMTPDVNKIVVFLSGGNQQKVVLAKCLCNDADILVFDEPTRGIDVGAKSEIYELMDRLVANGKAILMVSSDLLEIMGICDRVYVMKEGSLVGELNREEFSQEKIIGLSLRSNKHEEN